MQDEITTITYIKNVIRTNFMDMKKNYLKWAISLFVSSLTLSSCLTDDAIIENLNKKYESLWEETMGKVDPNHTWNTAGLGIVTANIGGEGNYNLKLYTSNPRMTSKASYLLANFEVKGGETIKQDFDMPTNLTHIYASLVDAKGYRMVKSADIIDGTIHFDFTEYTSRAIDDGSDDIVSWKTTKDSNGNITYYYFNEDDYKTPLKALPEGQKYDATFFQSQTETVLYTNFLYLSTGAEFTIYPFYNITGNQTLTLGIYYYDNNGIIKEHNIWQMSTAETTYDGITWTSMGTNSTTNHGKGNYTTSGRLDQEENPIKTPIRIPGITIKVNKGVKFGFYITTQQAENPKVYSESSLNNSFNNTTHFGATYHSHHTGNCEYFLTFEDYNDFDYNDLIVKIGGKPNNGDVGSLNDQQILPIVDIEEENTSDVPMTYIVAYEDMGAIGDFDFNDAVLGIEYISTNIGKEARFKAMAAGGTLPISVKYNETTIWEEMHQAFGKDSKYPINVGNNGTLPYVYSDYIKVEDDFTILSHAQHLKIQVKRNDNLSTTIGIPNPDKEQGAIPQAFLIADPTWEWPREGQHIINNTCYGEDFSQWISDNSYTSWYGKAWTDNTEEEEYPEGGETPDYGTSFINYYNPSTLTANIPYENLPIGNNGIIITLKTQDPGNCSIYYKTNEWTQSFIVSYSYGEANNYRNYPITINNLNTISNNEYCKDLFIQTYDNNSITELYIKPAE